MTNCKLQNLLQRRRLKKKIIFVLKILFFIAIINIKYSPMFFWFYRNYIIYIKI